MTLFDDLVDAIERNDFAALIQSSDESLPALLTAATELFDTFPRSVQATTMAIMLGMMHATMEGEHVQGEATMGVIITSVERMCVFVAQYHVSYRESMAARASDPEMHQTKGTVQ